MSYLGDFATGVTLDTKFCTVTTTGAPTQLAGTPAISVYKDNSATQSTSGVTLSVDFDSVTGLNNVRIDTSSDGTFYSSGSNFQVVITTGTVGGTSVVGYVVAEFSLNNRSSLRPTTAGRTLDVSAGGEAGVDWANVGSQGTTVGLTATTVAAVTSTAAIGTGGIAATSFAAGAIDAAAIAADAIGAAEIANGAIDAATFAAGAINAAAIADGAIDAATFAAGAIDATAIAADAIGSSELAASAAQEIADEILNRNLAGGGSGGARIVRDALRALRNRRATPAGTLTVYQEDDTTPAWTAAVTTAAGNPITEIDPA